MFRFLCFLKLALASKFIFKIYTISVFMKFGNEERIYFLFVLLFDNRQRTQIDVKEIISDTLTIFCQLSIK